MKIGFGLRAHFPRGYIAEPYWPDIERLINIQKESGMNLCRAPAKRRAALEGHLRAIGMTLAEYEALEIAAGRPFHTAADGTIVIPGDKVAAFLVHVCDVIRAAGRPCRREMVRSLITTEDWITDRIGPDGVWERFAVVQGAGGKLSNQRGLRRSHYIADFEARGALSVDDGYVKPDVLEDALRWGGEMVGLGACRKMGWGRFTLVQFARLPGALAAE